MSRDGAAEVANGEVASEAGSSSLAFGESAWGLAWTYQSTVRFLTLSPSGEAPARAPVLSGMWAYGPRLVYTGSEFAVVFVQYDGEVEDIYYTSLERCD
jgi:hypothetical protein